MPLLYEQVARKVIREITDYEFWHWLCKDSRKGAANAIARSKDEQKVGELIMANKAAFIEQTKVQRQLKEASKGGGKGGGKKGKGKGK